VNSLTDQQLLRDYASRRSESAFAELARRHVDLVYSAALRMVHDAHLAEDITQAVFIALSKSAGQLLDRPVLSGWLHRSAQNLAANAVRTEVRRRAREQEAVAMNELLANETDTDWENIAPYLDAALGELSEPDRDALLLRYFERKSAREMSAILNVSEEAAQKRVSRAVERLRELFSKRNVTLGASGLVVLISANAVQAAPIGLLATISTATLVGIPVTATTSTATRAMINFLNAKTIGAVLISALVVGTSAYLIQKDETNNRRDEIQTSIKREEKLSPNRDTVLAGRSERNDEQERSREEHRELLRLRNQVGMLRQQTNDLQTLLRTGLTEQRSATAQQEQEQFVSVGGQARFPNRVRWTNGLTLNDVLRAVGGFTDSADASKIKIIRTDGTTNRLSYLDSPTTIILQNDLIWIPELKQTSGVPFDP
jgi:RNA polymerase sigma factor (sigma-70 family)